MKRLIATAVLASLVAGPAFAQSYQYNQQNPDEGLYAGAGLGNSMLDNDTLNELEDLGANTDDSDTGYKLFAGYQFNPNFAIEASYLDFGDFKANGIWNGEPADAKFSAEGFGFALVGKLPIQSGFSVHGKVGMVAWDGDASANFTDDAGNRWTVSGGEDGTDPYYGVGAEYEINQVIMRAEYERYEISDSGEDFEIDLVSASLGYRF